MSDFASISPRTSLAMPGTLPKFNIDSITVGDPQTTSSGGTVTAPVKHSYLRNTVIILIAFSALAVVLATLDK